ncbi:MAG: hypothetical protein ACM3ZA_12495 [Bacillota bacterium]
MAEPTPLTEKIDRTLNWLFGGAADIRELAVDWPDLDQAERASQELEWFADMTGELPFLHEQYMTGAMSEEQRRRYLALLRELQEMLPVMRQIDLELPHVPIEEVLREQAADRP